MKILLVNPIKEGFSNFSIFPPIGLGYIATSLRKEGFNNVKILDCVKECFTINDFDKHIRVEKPDVVGFTVFSLAIKNVLNLTKVVKTINNNIITLVGGPHPSAIPERVLEEENIDYGFVGEGEKGVPLLMKYLCVNRTEKLCGIPGLIYRENGKVIYNQQSFVSDIDSLGFPAWDLIDPPSYFGKGVDIKKNTTCILMTRGCPYSCSFCSAHTLTGKKLRSRSVNNVIEEIEFLTTRYKIFRYVILDENFTAKHDFVGNFCEKIISLNKRYKFILPNGVRLDALSEDILRLMLKAGFSKRLAVGIESGSDRVLKLMNKRLSTSLIQEKIKLMAKVGFRPIGYFIIGYPGESKGDIMQTIKFAKKLKLYEVAFTCYLPMPGTTTYKYLIEHGELSSNYDFTKLNTDRITYVPNGITLKELARLKRKALLGFYLRPIQLFYLLRNVKHLKFTILKFFKIFINFDHLKNIR